MRKKEELSSDNTCMGHAHPDEMVFVLIGRDPAAPVAVRAWVAERLRLGKNAETDPQVVEALRVADTMELEGRCWVTALHVVTITPTPTRDELAEALAESVELQSHYAALLNLLDGGKRAAFADVDAWIQRLRDLKQDNEA